MKTILIAAVFATVVLAEKMGPYPASGWKPDGPQFTYPPPTPSNEYGPASTPANQYVPATTQPPTETTTEPPKEPPATYVPSEETTESSNNGYARYQPDKPFARFNQGAGQFFIITPQGQLHHIPIAVPSVNNRDVEEIENTANGDRETVETFGQMNRLMQKTAATKKGRGGGDGKSKPTTQLTSVTLDGRLEKVQAVPSSKKSSEKSTAADPGKGQTQFVAFIPAVPLRQVAAAAVMQPMAAQQNGQYHVIYPNGRLHRVQYMNTLGPNNRLTANVQYQEVDPIRGPLYTFGSPLVRVL